MYILGCQITRFGALQQFYNALSYLLFPDEVFPPETIFTSDGVQLHSNCIVHYVILYSLHTYVMFIMLYYLIDFTGFNFYSKSFA